MTDPDAPSRANPVNGEIKHWLVINIKGDDVKSGITYAGVIAFLIITDHKCVIIRNVCF